MLPSPLSRRAFLASGAALAATATPAGALAAKARRKAREPLVRAGAFDCGVAAGAPGTDRVVLWTHVADVDRNSRVLLEVARDPGFSKVVLRRSVRVPAIRDFTARATVGGLKPGEQYFYRFASRTVDSPVGRFRTARPAGSRDPVKVAFFSCQDLQAGYYNAHAALAQEDDVDLVVCLGDYVYEETFYEGPEDRRDRTGTSKESDPAFVFSLPEWRAKHRLYKSDRDLQAMHAAHPFVAIWDDHEVEDNYAGDERDPQKQGDPEFTPYDLLERRRAGYLSFFEYMPRVRMKPVTTQIYGAVPLGLADVVLLDQRQYRDVQPCDDRFIQPCTETDTPGRTLLGEQQKRWFKDAVVGSKAQWKLVGNQLMVMALDSAPGQTVNVDAWDGYAAERREILEHFATNGVKDLSFMTGDIHTFFAGEVHTNGRTTGTPVGTEFVGGSVTSLGFEHVFPGPERQAIHAGLLTTNPHIKYAELQSRGYAIAEVSPERMKVTYKGVDARVRGAKARELASFTVQAGSTEIEQA